MAALLACQTADGRTQTTIDNGGQPPAASRRTHTLLGGIGQPASRHNHTPEDVDGQPVSRRAHTPVAAAGQLQHAARGRRSASQLPHPNASRRQRPVGDTPFDSGGQLASCTDRPEDGCDQPASRRTYKPIISL